MNYLCLIRKDPTIHMHSLAVYVKEGLPFAWEKTLQILTYVFDWLYLIQCLTSFSSINQLLSLYALFFNLYFI